jgi:ophiobolin F synthase
MFADDIVKVDYLFSTRPPSQLHEDDPRYFSVFIPRIHKDSTLTNDIAVQCQIDRLGLENIGKRICTLETVAGNVVALCYPECLPERIPLFTYIIENLLIRDGKL